MEKVIQQLGEIANELDNKGLVSHADSVDKIMKTAFAIKTAQYVGVQGYAIRNSRCWGNCYRQKRASSPDRPTQEIWAECHEEYTKSIDNDNARKEWDKYAGNEPLTIKTADRKNIDKNLSNIIKDYIKDGKDWQDAISSSVLVQKEEIFNNVIAASSSLLKVAEKLQKDNFELSVKIGKVAQEMSKEAQWWHPATMYRNLQDQKGRMDEWAQNKGEDYTNKKLKHYQDQAKNLQDRRNKRWPGSSTPSVGTPSAPAGATPPSTGTPSAPAGVGSPAAAPSVPNVTPPGSPPGSAAAAANAGATGGSLAGTGGATDQTQAISKQIVDNIKSLRNSFKDKKQFISHLTGLLTQAGIGVGGSQTPPAKNPTGIVGDMNTSNFSTGIEGLNNSGNFGQSWAGPKPNVSNKPTIV